MAFEMKSACKTSHYGPSKSIDDQHGNHDPFPRHFNEENASDSLWRAFLYIVAIILAIVMFPLSLLYCVLVVKEYERVVIFRLGRLHHTAKGPGILLVLPCVENHIVVDMRTFSANVPSQKVLTKDLVTVSVDAVIYYHIVNATLAETKIQDPHESTKLLAQTILRSTLGRFSYSDMLQNREIASEYLQKSLDGITDDWGIKIERVDIKQFSLPSGLQRSLAAEAEATREANAKVIAAEGEKMASIRLKEAADELSLCPASIQLRCLQTLNTVSANDNSTITFPLPVDLIESMFDGLLSIDKQMVTNDEADTSLSLNYI